MVSQSLLVVVVIVGWTKWFDCLHLHCRYDHALSVSEEDVSAKDKMLIEYAEYPFVSLIHV